MTSAMCMLKHKSSISSIPTCYAKYHNVNILHLTELLNIFGNSIVLAISGHERHFETPRHLGLGPAFAI